MILLQFFNYNIISSITERFKYYNNYNNYMRQTILKGGIKEKMQKQKQFLAFSILCGLLAISIVSASGLSYSLRGYEGNIVQIGSESDFSYEKIQFSAYYSEGSAGSGQGSITLLALTPEKERFSVNVKLVNPVIVQNDNSTLVVENTGYFYERAKTWNGFWTLNKVEGKVTYTLDKNTGLLSVAGTDGLNFGADGIKAIQLK
jgi:hypothetical protein